MDLVVVTHGPDIKLLRHFIESYILYYNSKNKLYIFSSARDSELIQEINLPDNASILLREDYEGVVDSTPFSQQLYLKLAAYRVVTTEYFCIMDSDFLFIGPTCDADFFHDGKPVWFYREWAEGEPPLRWRAGSERFAGSSIDYNYGDVAQYVFKRSVAADLARKYDLSRILNDDTISEFLVYAWFAHRNHAHEYHFASDTTVIQPVVRMVNQIPPDYCYLDSGSNYDQFKSSKCLAFWSHWELAESKMIEFFEDSQHDHFGQLRLLADRKPLYRVITPETLERGEFRDVEGTYADGWVKENVHLRLVVPPLTSVLQIELDIPGNPADSEWRLGVGASLRDLPGADVRVDLDPGTRRLAVNVPEEVQEGRVLLRLAFEPGFRDPGNPDQREFRARLRGLRFVSAIDQVD